MSKDDTYDFLNPSKEKFLRKYPFINYFEIKKWFRELNVRVKGSHGLNQIRFSNYVYSMRHYMKFTKMNPTKLIDEVELDLKKDRRKQENPAGNRIKGFFNYLINKGYAPKTVASNVNNIRGFYKHNGYRINVHIPAQDPTKTKIELTKDILRRLLHNIQKIRDKAIILIMISSGMSIFDIFELKYRNLNLNENPMKITFRRIKNNNLYETFISTECKEILIEYLNQFRKDIKTDDVLFLTSNNKPLYYEAFYQILSDASIKTIGSKKINTKSFRRFFTTQMKKSGISSDIVDYWTGHSIGIGKDYLDINQLKEIYVKHENVITIFKDLDENAIKQLEIKMGKEVRERLEEQDRKILLLEQLIHSLLEDKI